MEIREHVIEYLKTLKEVAHHTNADESDEIETREINRDKAKMTLLEKQLLMVRALRKSLPSESSAYFYLSPVNSKSNDTKKHVSVLNPKEKWQRG